MIDPCMPACVHGHGCKLGEYDCAFCNLKGYYCAASFSDVHLFQHDVGCYEPEDEDSVANRLWEACQADPSFKNMTRWLKHRAYIGGQKA
jgi:hypothetical protein